MRNIEIPFVAAITAALAMTASAGAPRPVPTQVAVTFDREHPRRAEIDGRIERQQRELARRLKEGGLTREQYLGEMGKLNRIMAEETSYASAQRGHLTEFQRWSLGDKLDRTHDDIASGNETPVGTPVPAEGDIQFSKP